MKLRNHPMATINCKKRKRDVDVSSLTPLKKRKKGTTTGMQRINRISKLDRECQAAIRIFEGLETAEVIIDTMLSLSGHTQVISFWKAMIKRLGELAFMMDEPEPLSKIQEFERKYRAKTGNAEFCIPGMLRISLLICGALDIPQIFDHSLEQYTDHFHIDRLSILESVLLPLEQWGLVGDRGISNFHFIDECRGLDDYEIPTMDILTESGWVNPESRVFPQTFCIGECGSETQTSYLFLNGDEVIYYGIFGVKCEFLDVIRWQITDLFQIPLSAFKESRVFSEFGTGCWAIGCEGEFDEEKFIRDIELFTNTLWREDSINKRTFSLQKHNDFMNYIKRLFAAQCPQ